MAAQPSESFQSNVSIARALAERAEEPSPAETAGWVPLEQIQALVELVQGGLATPQQARQIGRELVAVARLGLELRRTGIATPEKAYRRCDALLAREGEGDVYVVSQMGGERARIEFRPANGRVPRPFFCHVREGMLAGLPGALGLPPARVRELRCAGRGAPACEFDVRFRRAPRVGLQLGALTGALLAAAILITSAATAPGASGIVLGLAAGLALGFGAAFGHAVDSMRKLRAYETARAETPGWLEQTERALADKIDELARFEQAAPPEAPAAEREASGEEASQVAEAAREIHASVGTLQSALASLHDRVVRRQDGTREELERLIEECVDDARRLHGIGAQLAGAAGGSAAHRRPGDVGAAVGHVVDAFRAICASGLRVSLEVSDALPRIAFEPYQLDVVVGQLLDNAAAALDGSGEIRVGVWGEPAGVEIAVADDGPGIDEELVDQLFDPFFEASGLVPGAPSSDGEGEAPANGGARGLGLAVCYRIVKEHGGELRVEGSAGEGTTVTLTLPRTLGAG